MKRTSSSRTTVNDRARGNDIYIVEEILDEREQRNRLTGVFESHWNIRWQGYGAEEDTYEPAANLAGLESDIAKFRAVRNCLT